MLAQPGRKRCSSIVATTLVDYNKRRPLPVGPARPWKEGGHRQGSIGSHGAACYDHALESESCCPKSSGLILGSIMLVVQVSDSHLIESEDGLLYGINTLNTFRQAVESIGRMSPRPDLILHTGDLAEDGSLAAYRRLDQLFQGLAIPYVWIPGNHDSLPAMAAALPISPKRWVRDNWQFVLVSSKLEGEETHDGMVSPQELDHLRESLQQARHPTVVAIHHHPIPVFSRWLDEGYPLRNADEFVNIVERFPCCKIVLFGHVHQEVDRVQHGIRYLCAPSTFEQFQPRTETLVRDPRLPGFRVLDLAPDGTFETHILRYELA